MGKIRFFIYPGDYLRDTSGLTLEEHGAYFLLMMDYYSRGEALPNDPKYLRRVLGVSAHKLKKLQNIFEKFFKNSENRLTHLRIEKELAAQRKISETRRLAGDKGNSRLKELRANANASGIAVPYPLPSKEVQEDPKVQSSPAQASDPQPRTRKGKPRKSIKIEELEIPAHLDNDEGRAAIGDWLEYKSGIGDSYKTPKFLQDKLAEFSSSTLLRAAVTHSAGSGYRGLCHAKSTNGPSVGATRFNWNEFINQFPEEDEEEKPEQAQHSETR